MYGAMEIELASIFKNVNTLQNYRDARLHFIVTYDICKLKLVCVITYNSNQVACIIRMTIAPELVLEQSIYKIDQFKSD